MQNNPVILKGEPPPPPFPHPCTKHYIQNLLHISSQGERPASDSCGIHTGEMGYEGMFKIHTFFVSPPLPPPRDTPQPPTNQPCNCHRFVAGYGYITSIENKIKKIKIQSEQTKRLISLSFLSDSFWEVNQSTPQPGRALPITKGQKITQRLLFQRWNLSSHTVFYNLVSLTSEIISKLKAPNALTFFYSFIF